MARKKIKISKGLSRLMRMKAQRHVKFFLNEFEKNPEKRQDYLQSWNKALIADIASDTSRFK